MTETLAMWKSPEDFAENMQAATGQSVPAPVVSAKRVESNYREFSIGTIACFITTVGVASALIGIGVYNADGNMNVVETLGAASTVCFGFAASIGIAVVQPVRRVRATLRHKYEVLKAA